MSDLRYPYEGRNSVCTIVLFGRAGTLSESRLPDEIHRLLRFDNLEILSGIDKRREPVVCEGVWGNLLPDVVGRQ